MRDEVAAVHERVGVLDLTGFAKYDISGPRRRGLFESRVRQPDAAQGGRHRARAPALAGRARIHGEMTVTRLADDRFYALSAAAAELRDRDWLHAEPAAGRGACRSTMSPRSAACWCLSGPRSRELLRQLTDARLGNEEFPWLRAREIHIAGQPVRALRVSYVGELGWELHPPIECACPRLYDAMWEARPRTRDCQLWSVCGQQHAHREGLQGLVDRADQ